MYLQSDVTRARQIDDAPEPLHHEMCHDSGPSEQEPTRKHQQNR